MPRWITSLLLLWLSAEGFRAQAQAQITTAVVPNPSMDALDDRYIIGPKFRLSIRILEERVEPEVRLVPDNGVIEIPHVGPVKAAGMTCRELAQAVRAKLVASPAYTQGPGLGKPLSGLQPPTVVVAIENLGACVPFALDRSQLVVRRVPGQTVERFERGNRRNVFSATEEKRLGADILTRVELLDHTRRIEAGDEISLRILEEGKPAVALKVLATGEIEVPRLGKIRAAGLTARSLSKKLSSKFQQRFFWRFPLLRKPLFPKATVIVCIDRLAHPVVVR